jgi:hypothetical protein
MEKGSDFKNTYIIKMRTLYTPIYIYIHISVLQVGRQIYIVPLIRSTTCQITELNKKLWY